MANKKKAALAADTLVAASPIAIEGKHFDRGDAVTDVSDEELRKAVSIKRVVKASELAAAAAPAPEPEAEPEADPEGEPEAGEAD